MIIYRAEYFNDKLEKWISVYENEDMNEVLSNLNFPIFGNPKKKNS